MVLGRRRKIKDKRIHNSDYKFDIDGKESTSRYVFLCNEIRYIERVSNNRSLYILEVKYVTAYKIAKRIFWFVVELGVISWDDITLFLGNDGP